MKLFNKCLWHNWKYTSKHYDYTDICLWSSGSVDYRECLDCGRKEQKRYHEKEYKVNKC